MVNMKKNKSKQKSRKMHRGGMSNACVLENAMNNSGSSMCSAASNLHNVNPQASLDTISMGGYGSPVPLGANILGGGGSCGDEGVSTSSTKSETFKQYLDNLSNKLDISSQYGGGYTIDPKQMIGGLPVNRGYDDCCPPAIVGGNLQFGAPDQPVCGLGAIRGGGSKKKYKKSHKRSSKKKSKSKYMKRTKTQMRGGDWNSIGQSKPAVYADAFNGPKSVFEYPDDMTKRNFSETQPNYSVNAI